ncbi:MAG: helix-turn-helix transcriptional regulator [Deltaproteobacteria bacterium]|nr:helix-turn-helix transcriptional regulator [Deltaproteobacteria bacterium]
MSVSRTYKSPLREEQAEQTRERLLETLTELLASDADGDSVTVALVAERAKVSVRTAYRYFPTKDAMLDAFNKWMRTRLGSPEPTTSIEGMPDMAAKLLTSFAENESVIRASRRSRSDVELRKVRKAEQVRAVKKAVEKFAPQLDDLKSRQVGAMLHNVFGSEPWLNMLDNWGLSTPEAIEAVRWGLDAMITKLETERARKGRK